MKLADITGSVINLVNEIVIIVRTFLADIISLLIGNFVTRTEINPEPVNAFISNLSIFRERVKYTFRVIICGIVKGRVTDMNCIIIVVSIVLSYMVIKVVKMHADKSKGRNSRETELKEFVESISNGSREVGINAGSDPSLHASIRLNVKRNHVIGDATDAALHNYAIMSGVLGNELDAEKRKVIKSALFAIFLFDLIKDAKDRTKNDQDAIYDLDDYEQNDIEIPDDDDIANALVLICATKVNWYSSNHHTGQGEITGYLKKTLNVTYGVEKYDVNSWIKVCHTIGHWCNTRKVLIRIGFDIPGMTDEERRMEKFTLADDLRLRVNSMPAGTARLSLSYNILTRMKNHMLFGYFKNVAMFKEVVEAYNEVMSSPFAYHINAHLVCGNHAIKFDDQRFERVLAVCATFIDVINPNSTLAASPLIKSKNARKYEDMEGYDDAFSKLCVNFRRVATTVNPEGLESAIASNVGSFQAAAADNRRIIGEINSKIKADEVENDESRE